jgi:AcrR family transcriptional regulator
VGRVNQKERTRAALVQAATGLLRRGTPPTVAEAAEAAKVSRATAYRYFPTQEALLIEVAGVSAATAPVEEWINAMPPGGDAEEGLLRLLDVCNRIMFAEEATMRTALRAYMDTWLESRRNGVEAPVVREGRRMRWLDRALAPARGRFSEPQWRRLRAALALTLSTEALIVMKDVCRFEDEEEALGVLAWAASALLRAGLDEARNEPADAAVTPP